VGVFLERVARALQGEAGIERAEIEGALERIQRRVKLAQQPVYVQSEITTLFSKLSQPLKSQPPTIPLHTTPHHTATPTPPFLPSQLQSFSHLISLLSTITLNL
jgi:hypothetical protein